ncbi:hypothetical protein D4764_15G0001860 [Takifugu flavidus]|uniref:Uncharacterized protein n=1 Tax=Takifugu flavidus TaxID=433684 RepID=A0A5C6NZ34_9TELE|nr:hypothetical protein D4764_15G0001860 [Takifugu flavidus]
MLSGHLLTAATRSQSQGPDTLRKPSSSLQNLVLRPLGQGDMFRRFRFATYLAPTKEAHVSSQGGRGRPSEPILPGCSRKVPAPPERRGLSSKCKLLLRNGIRKSLSSGSVLLSGSRAALLPQPVCPDYS